MGILAIKYVKAEELTEEVRAKRNIALGSIVRVTMSNDEFNINYETVASVYQDIKGSFTGSNKNTDLSSDSL